MQLTVAKIHSIYTALESLSTNKDMKAKTSFVVLMNMRKLKDYVDAFEKSRISIFKKYGEEKDGKLSVPVDSDNFQKFKEEVEDLTKSSHDIDLKKFKFLELEALNISAQELDRLFDLIDLE